ncbi:dTMP kinase [Gloeothece citriformis PCC 7424]|uniref:Thymidylate kinase n=1 Tax=Gloeothece citriformis (strain PCC 7424) TaxID=65393 RepID=B7KFY8_GLOC7|nr:dTMP kinase [Gloeothece citriformis]ACK69181.1 dTMP kinase [Gloeothece citriformis PCC 7424]
MKKLFIVLEGIDGSGTSTQASLLQDYFINKGEKAVISPEPTSGVIGKLIREAMQKPIICLEDQQKFDQQMAYLFAADRHYHLYNDSDGVFKLIEKDQCHVITTRYYFSSLAYNCHTPEEFKFVSQLNERFPNPDLVIYIDLPVEVSLERLQERTIKDVYENREKLTQVRNNYHNIFSRYNGLILKIDGTETIIKINQNILKFVNTHF